MDGGIIITDGSNPDDRYKHISCKPLWKYNNESRYDGGEDPEDFVYENRVFNLLGQCGDKDNVYAWKVTRLKDIKLKGQKLSCHALRSIK